MDVLNQTAEALIECYRNGGKLLVCGNGGSAADSGHIVGELVKGFLKKRPLAAELESAIGEDWAAGLQQGLPAVDLTSMGPALSAAANDIDGTSCYAQLVTAFGKPGDVFLGISTSGNAENVRRAMVTAHAMGLVTVSLTGEGGGKIGAIADIPVCVPERETYRVQEEHIKFYHQLCILVEQAFFTK